MAKKRGKVVVQQAMYDRLASSCIACLAGVPLIHRPAGYFHWVENGEVEYSLCENNTDLKDILKGLSQEDKEIAANEMIYVIMESRLMGIRAGIKNLIDTTPKAKLPDALADFCEEYFRAGMVEGISRKVSNFSTKEPQ